MMDNDRGGLFANYDPKIAKYNEIIYSMICDLKYSIVL